MSGCRRIDGYDVFVPREHRIDGVTGVNVKDSEAHSLQLVQN
jgi:hypothetical protein